MLGSKRDLRFSKWQNGSAVLIDLFDLLEEDGGLRTDEQVASARAWKGKDRPHVSSGLSKVHECAQSCNRSSMSILKAGKGTITSGANVPAFMEEGSQYSGYTEALVAARSAFDRPQTAPPAWSPPRALVATVRVAASSAFRNPVAPQPRGKRRLFKPSPQLTVAATTVPGIPMTDAAAAGGMPCGSAAARRLRQKLAELHGDDGEAARQELQRRVAAARRARMSKPTPHVDINNVCCGLSSLLQLRRADAAARRNWRLQQALARRQQLQEAAAAELGRLQELMQRPEVGAARAAEAAARQQRQRRTLAVFALMAATVAWQRRWLRRQRLAAEIDDANSFGRAAASRMPDGKGSIELLADFDDADAAGEGGLAEVSVCVANGDGCDERHSSSLASAAAAAAAARTAGMLSLSLSLVQLTAPGPSSTPEATARRWPRSAEYGERHGRHPHLPKNGAGLPLRHAGAAPPVRRPLLLLRNKAQGTDAGGRPARIPAAARQRRGAPCRHHGRRRRRDSGSGSGVWRRPRQRPAQRLSRQRPPSLAREQRRIAAAGGSRAGQPVAAPPSAAPGCPPPPPAPRLLRRHRTAVFAAAHQRKRRRRRRRRHCGRRGTRRDSTRLLFHFEGCGDLSGCGACGEGRRRQCPSRSRWYGGEGVGNAISLASGCFRGGDGRRD
ncbi:unnamed protein product [Phaeothamnion confervicola]